jgi:hypothetical protein
LKIEAGEKVTFATEEFDGWAEFTGKLFDELPDINKNWEGIIAVPAFRRNETELYNRNKDTS